MDELRKTFLYEMKFRFDFVIYPHSNNFEPSYLLSSYLDPFFSYLLEDEDVETAKRLLKTKVFYI
jgi:hypothetical protein